MKPENVIHDFNLRKRNVGRSSNNQRKDL